MRNLTMLLAMASAKHIHTGEKVETIFVGVSLWKSLLTEAREKLVVDMNATEEPVSITLHGILIRSLPSLSVTGIMFP